MECTLMHNMCIKQTLGEFVVLTGHGIIVFNLPLLHRSIHKCTLSVIRIIQYTIVVSSDRIDTLKEFDTKGLHTKYTRDTQIDIVLTGLFKFGALQKDCARENASYRIHNYGIK